MKLNILILYLFNNIFVGNKYRGMDYFKELVQEVKNIFIKSDDTSGSTPSTIALENNQHGIISQLELGSTQSKPVMNSQNNIPDIAKNVTEPDEDIDNDSLQKDEDMVSEKIFQEAKKYAMDNKKKHTDNKRKESIEDVQRNVKEENFLGDVDPILTGEEDFDDNHYDVLDDDEHTKQPKTNTFDKIRQQYFQSHNKIIGINQIQPNKTNRSRSWNIQDSLNILEINSSKKITGINQLTNIESFKDLTIKEHRHRSEVRSSVKTDDDLYNINILTSCKINSQLPTQDIQIHHFMNVTDKSSSLYNNTSEQYINSSRTLSSSILPDILLCLSTLTNPLINKPASLQEDENLQKTDRVHQPSDYSDNSISESDYQLSSSSKISSDKSSSLVPTKRSGESLYLYDSLVKQKDKQLLLKRDRKQKIKMFKKSKLITSLSSHFPHNKTILGDDYQLSSFNKIFSNKYYSLVPKKRNSDSLCLFNPSVKQKDKQSLLKECYSINNRSYNDNRLQEFKNRVLLSSSKDTISHNQQLIQKETLSISLMTSQKFEVSRRENPIILNLQTIRTNPQSLIYKHPINQPLTFQPLTQGQKSITAFTQYDDTQSTDVNQTTIKSPLKPEEFHLSDKKNFKDDHDSTMTQKNNLIKTAHINHPTTIITTTNNETKQSNDEQKSSIKNKIIIISIISIFLMVIGVGASIIIKKKNNNKKLKNKKKINIKKKKNKKKIKSKKRIKNKSRVNKITVDNDQPILNLVNDDNNEIIRSSSESTTDDEKLDKNFSHNNHSMENKLIDETS